MMETMIKTMINVRVWVRNPDITDRCPRAIRSPKQAVAIHAGVTIPIAHTALTLGTIVHQTIADDAGRGCIRNMLPTPCQK